MAKTQTFIEKARAVHGDRYGYDRVVYVRNRDKVIITCKKHGDFEQAPNGHLRGDGCAKCAGKHAYSTREWVQEAIAVHGDRYDYSKAIYTRGHDKVIITCTKHGDFEQTPSSHLSGAGCAKCGKESMAAKNTQKAKDSFIEKARAVHGDSYDYQRVVYVRSKDKVVITCKNHGNFEQAPSNHLSGQGCPKCGIEATAAKIVQEAKYIFVDKACAVHGDRYSYDRVVYIRAHDKVIITCRQHGDFEQMPNNHLTGRGCAKCGLESRAAKKTQKAKNSFIEKARAAHGDRYSYDRVVYTHSKGKVIITCAKHGDFEQVPYSHLKGHGCARCSGLHRYSTQEWVQEAIAVHGDRYDYSKVVYVRAHAKVAVTCKEHGDFEQTPNDHLMGKGCPSCPVRRDQPTNLYLMHNGLGKVKVGYSIDVDARISRLNRDAPFEAELLETWTLPDTPTVRKIESKVHRALAKYHAGLSGFDGATEWFNASPDTARKHILDAIRGSYVVKNYVKNNPQMSLI